MTATPSDVMAIHRAIDSFRMGAPIQSDDVRFASKMDGHSLDHLLSIDISVVMAEYCDRVPRTDVHAYALYCRRA